MCHEEDMACLRKFLCEYLQWVPTSYSCNIGQLDIGNLPNAQYAYMVSVISDGFTLILKKD